MKIERFVCNMFQENCYVVSDDTKECIVIDCGAFFNEEKEAITRYISDNRLTPKHLLCTHGHVDHNFGNKFISDKFGLRPEICKADEPLMQKLPEQAKTFTGVACCNDMPSPAAYLSESDTIIFGNHSLRVIHTPGHSPGSIFFYCEKEKTAFSGDTLFQMSVGRTDLALGDYNTLMTSLQRIAKELPANTVILPGHGPHTTMAQEKAYNPYLRM